MERLVRDKIKSLRAYSPGSWNYKWKLNANESPYNLFDELSGEIMEELSKEELNKYPDPTGVELRGYLADYAGVSPERIVLGNGSDELIKMIMEVFVDSGDGIVVHTPTFSEYALACQIAGGEVIEVPSKKSYEIDIDGIIKAANANKAKVIFLCTPNNPTGAVISRSDIERTIDNTDAIVVVDEAYFEFFGETVTDIRNDRLIVLRTLSKAFGMAALRVGYAVTTEKTADYLGRVRMPYNLGAYPQAVARVAMRNIEHMKKNVLMLVSERERMNGELEGLSGLTVYKSRGNFILLGSSMKDKITELLSEKGIGIRNFSSKDLEDAVRINMGIREVNDTVIEVIRSVSNGEK